MALFVVIGHDGPDGPARRGEHRAAHVAHLDALSKAGKLPFAGPIRSEDDAQSVGAVLLLEAASLAEARELANRDPFVRGGVFASLTVAPFKQVYPKG